MKLEIKIPNLACSACVKTVTKAVQEVDAEAQVAAYPRIKQVSVITKTPEADIKNAITAAGFTLS